MLKSNGSLLGVVAGLASERLFSQLRNKQKRRSRYKKMSAGGRGSVTSYKCTAQNCNNKGKVFLLYSHTLPSSAIILLLFADGFLKHALKVVHAGFLVSGMLSNR